MKKQKFIISLIISLNLFFTLVGPVFAVDSDKDELDDLYEKVYGTDPAKPDTDGDGYMDGVEVKAGYDPVGPSKLTQDKIDAYKKMIDIISAHNTAGSGVNQGDTTSTAGTSSESNTGTPMESGAGITVSSGISTDSGADSGSTTEKVNNEPTVLANVFPPETIPYAPSNSGITDSSGSTLGSMEEEINVFSEILKEEIKKIIPDKLGNLWIATKNGLIKLDFDNFTYYTIKQGLPSNNVKDIAVASDNTVWILTQEGVTRFDPKSELKNAYVFYNENNGLKTKLGEKIYVDKDGKVWLGTDGTGIYVFDNTSWKELSQDPDLSVSRITTISSTKTGKIWVATDNKGAFEIDATNYAVSKYDTKSGIISNQIKDMFVTEDEIVWLATDFGLTKVENGKFENIEIRGNITGTNISTVYVDSNKSLWLGTDQGLSKYNEMDSTWTNVDSETGLNNGTVTSIIQDTKNNFWIGGKKGLVTFNNEDLDLQLSGGIGADSTSEDEIGIEAISVDLTALEDEMSAEDGDLLSSILSMIQEKVELAKGGDMASLVMLGGPVAVLLLLLLLVFIKEQQKKKTIESFENNLNQGVGQAPQQTPQNMPIASIGRPQMPMQNQGSVPGQNPFKPVAPAPNPFMQQPMPGTPIHPMQNFAQQPNVQNQPPQIPPFPGTPIAMPHPESPQMNSIPPLPQAPAPIPQPQQNTNNLPPFPGVPEGGQGN